MKNLVSKVNVFGFNFSERLYFYSIICFVYYLVIDYVSTIVAIQYTGIYEGNPISQKLLSSGLLFEFKFIGTILFIGVLVNIFMNREKYSFKRELFVDFLCIISSVLYIFVAINNLSIIFYFQF